MNVYLDHASTTPLHPAARDAMVAAFDAGAADPSRLYGAARRARIALDDARDGVARTLGGRAEEIVFTSGGTESCALALIGGARAARAARRPARVVVTAVEHVAVLRAAEALEAEGFEVIRTGVDATGTADLDAWRDALETGACIASMQLANPEVGTIQPVAEAAAIARAAGALMHSDACAAVGHVPVDAGALGVDLLSASSHKAYGPPGAGALWVRRGVRVRPLMLGDERERGRRGGLENLPAAAGFAAAARARADEIGPEMPRLRALAAHVRKQVPALVPDVVVHGDADRGLPGIVALSILYVEGEALLLGLDQAGIAVHSGSSCTTARNEPSHVLAAMGAMTQGSLRVSFGRDSTEADAAAFIDALPAVVERARAMVAP